METWLDARKPQDPRFFATDKATKLHYAVDSLIGLAISSPAGSLLSSALANVERAKFNQLERGLDPNRSTPADFAVYSVSRSADTFVANCIQDAADLAYNDPHYAAAVNPVLDDLIGVDTANSYNQIQDLYPNALPSLPTPTSDGSFNLDSKNLMIQYQAVIDSVQGVVDADFATLEGTSALQVRGQGALLTSQTGNASGPCSNPAQHLPCWDDAKSAVTAVSKLVGLTDSQLGSQISTVGNSVVNAGTAIDKLISTGAALPFFSSLTEFDTILGAGMEIFGLFGPGGSSPNSAVLQQIQKLSQQITRLQQDMDNRFNQIDAKLDGILATLNTNFAQINYTQGLLLGDAHAIQNGLLDAQAQLNQMERYLLAWTTALSKEEFIQSLNGCLGYQARTGADIGFTQYASCENVIYTYGHDISADELWAGILQPDYTDAGIYPTLLNFPFSVLGNYLAQFPAQNLQEPALTNGRIPNPMEWILAVRAYLELAHEWPQYASQINSSRIDDLIQVGMAYLQTAQNANSTNNAGVVSANQALYTAVDNKSNVFVLTLQNLVQAQGGLVTEFTADPSLKLGWIPPGGSYTVTLNLWSEPGQSNSFVPAALSSATIADCSGGPAWVMPANLISQFSPLVRNAEQLGKGAVSLCLSFSWFWAGTSLNNDPFGNGPADFALGAYQITGTQAGAVVFAETIYGYSITDPAHRILMCMGRPPLRSGHTEIWSQTGCTDEFDIPFAYYSITTHPVGSRCQTLTSATSGPSPLIWNLSPQFAQFVTQNGGLFVCVPGAPLTNLFAGNSNQTADTSAGLTSLATSINNTFVGYQQLLYGDIAGALCDPTTGCTSTGPFAGQLVSACQLVTGTKFLWEAYTNFGLPTSLQTDDVLHSLLYGNQGILDCSTLLSDFVGFSKSTTINTSDNKITDELSAMSARIAALNSAVTADLNLIQQTQTPESWIEIDNALADLRSFEAMKNSLAITPCTFELTPGAAIVGLQGGGGAFLVHVPDHCSSIASTNANWITITSTKSGTGQWTVTFVAAATADGLARLGIIIVGNQIFRVYHAPVNGVRPGNVTASVSPGAATIPVGTSANFTVVLNSSGGLSDSFTFACVNPPPGITCTFNPVTGPLPANGTLSPTLTIAVNAKPAAASSTTALRTPAPPFAARIAGVQLIAFVVLAGTCLRCTRNKPRLALAMLAMCSLFVIISCSGGTNTTQVAPQPPPSPTSATLLVTIETSSSTVTKAVGTVQITVP